LKFLDPRLIVINDQIEYGKISRLNKKQLGIFQIHNNFYLVTPHHDRNLRIGVGPIDNIITNYLSRECVNVWDVFLAIVMKIDE